MNNSGYVVRTFDLSKGEGALQAELNVMLEAGWKLIAITSHNMFIFGAIADPRMD